MRDADQGMVWALARLPTVLFLPFLGFCFFRNGLCMQLQLRIRFASPVLDLSIEESQTDDLMLLVRIDRVSRNMVHYYKDAIQDVIRFNPFSRKVV